MMTRIARWGNSMAVRIPKAVADAAKFRPGDPLQLAVNASGTVTICKKKAKLQLSELVRAITPENRHAETDWGEPVGNELW